MGARIMNKVRILTTKGQWVYAELTIMENRLAMPFTDAQGGQILFLDASYGTLRPETIGRTPCLYDKTKRLLYEGDIVEWQRLSKPAHYLICWSGSALTWELYTPLSPYSDDYIMDLGDFGNEGDAIKALKIIGNIHQNPELIGNAEQLEEETS
jgi:hypothetical protein